MAANNYEVAISLIDEAHAQDPNIAIVNGKDVPYELYYAQQSTHFLELRAPDASPVLKTAVRAQHFRRWEVPRTSYPATKAGYFQWRTFLKNRQAKLASAICLGCNFTAAEAEQVAGLIRKEDLKKNEDTQILEDVACLVFLSDQLEKFGKIEKDGMGSGEVEEGQSSGFESKVAVDEEKIVDILRKSWTKMSPEGQKLALELEMGVRTRGLVGRALEDN